MKTIYMWFSTAVALGLCSVISIARVSGTPLAKAEDHKADEIWSVDNKTVGSTVAPSANRTEPKECDPTKCVWKDWESLIGQGCQPVEKDDPCCPVEFDCKNANSTSKKDPSVCEYYGKQYALGQRIRDIDPCLICFCTEDISTYSHRVNQTDKTKTKEAIATCTHVECPEQFKADNLDARGCVPVFEEGKCCAVDFRCSVPENGPTPTPLNKDSTGQPAGDDNTNQTPKVAKNASNETSANSTESEADDVVCVEDDMTFIEGQRIYFDKWSCHECQCTANYTAAFGFGCQNLRCPLVLYAYQIKKKCTPILSDGACCPIDWICPGSGEDSANPSDRNMAGHTAAEPNFNESSRAFNANSCLLDKDTGPCKAYIPKYFYNSSAAICEFFGYGGCHGNDNNFDTVEECEKACSQSGKRKPNTMGDPGDNSTNSTSHSIEDRADTCSQEPEPGLCMALIPMYYFNQKTGKCETFDYGGCGGNKNRFESVAACQRECAN